MITASDERADITKQAVIKRELFFICSSHDPLADSKSVRQSERMSFHGLDEQHLCTALGDECPSGGDLFTHLLNEQIARRLVILEASRHVDISFCIDYANRVSSFCTRCGTILLCWTAVAPFHVAPQVDGFSLHSHRRSFGLC